LNSPKKTAAYIATFIIVLASTKTMKLGGPLSEVAIRGPATAEVSQIAGNINANAIVEPAGMKRIHPARLMVRTMLVIRELKNNLMLDPSPSIRE